MSFFLGWFLLTVLMLRLGTETAHEHEHGLLNDTAFLQSLLHFSDPADLQEEALLGFILFLPPAFMNRSNINQKEN